MSFEATPEDEFIVEELDQDSRVGLYKDYLARNYHYLTDHQRHIMLLGFREGYSVRNDDRSL